jgi:hypothetical protein
MSEQTEIETQISRAMLLLREKLGVRGKTLSKALGKARRRLPRRVHRQAQVLARAEPLAAHPRLRLTLDQSALRQAASEVESHLGRIDVADRRKGWFLGMLGGLVFNLILAFTLLILFLRWQGFL